MRKIVSLVLGGGRGTRLYPLTKVRSKPAVPLAGKYRLIDIPLSNCINSGLNRIYVLTQFNSVSLHRHIRSTYNFDPFERGFVEILAAQQTNDRSDWYQGTADAVRQNLRYLQQPDVAQVLILAGDQLYRMNYREMIQLHRRTKADVTISAVPVHGKDASGLGIMRLDDSGRVIGFVEKPQTREQLDLVRTDPAWIDAQGIESRGRDCLASTGIYLFDRDLLVDLLQKNNDRDFGKEVFPAAIRSCRVQVHLFDGYWEDIGTIRAFYEANLALAKADPPFVAGLARRADLHPGPFPASQPLRRGHGPGKPDRRRLRDLSRGGDREQHRRAPRPHRRERANPQLDPLGQRLLPPAGRQRGGSGRRPASARHWRRQPDRRGHHRQELPHRLPRPRGQRRRRGKQPRVGSGDGGRRHPGDSQGVGLARRLGDVGE